MALHRLVNVSADALVTADGSLWEAGEARLADPSDPVLAGHLATDKLYDAGVPDDPPDAPVAEPAPDHPVDEPAPDDEGVS